MPVACQIGRVTQNCNKCFQINTTMFLEQRCWWICISLSSFSKLLLMFLFNALQVNISWKVFAALPVPEWFSVISIAPACTVKGLHECSHSLCLIAATVPLQFDLFISRKSETNELTWYGKKLDHMHVGYIIMPKKDPAAPPDHWGHSSPRWKRQKAIIWDDYLPSSAQV